MFSKVILWTHGAGYEEKEVVVFKKGNDIGVYVFTRGNLNRATTLPRYGTGFSLKFICFSAGSLTTI
jgi:hypothetical protein